MTVTDEPYVSIGELQVRKCLYDFVAEEVAPQTGVSPEKFWNSFEEILFDFAPKNRRLLEFRDELQSKIDSWHSSNREDGLNPEKIQEFLSSIGYLVPEGPAFTVDVKNVDPEIATTNAPQLVVPVDNARYAINAVNARWGSLYDALYSSGIFDSSGESDTGTGYDPVRGAKVIAWAKNFLDSIIPLNRGSHTAAIKYYIGHANDSKMELSIALKDGSIAKLVHSELFAGFQGPMDDPVEILIRHNGLHIRLQFDRSGAVGKSDLAGIEDISMEAAVTTIQDFEDAVAAVDAEDKTRAYRNWLNLMKGTLSTKFKKNDTPVQRTMNSDIEFIGTNGKPISIAGRSMMFVRHTGIHMYTDAVTTAAGEQIPEGFLDAMIITLCAMHDLNGNSALSNSRTGSIYVVKPKLHGPEEVAVTVEMFGRVEDALGLDRNTLKIGIMDEERRTTVNLKECIRAASNRVVFINTGFLDRTGDEIHTLMKSGPVIRKEEIKKATWLTAYEDWNVDVGIATGVHETGQIGKGMWTMPDLLNAMYENKIGHLNAGANTAWVPSPTSAVIHALHYHKVDVDDLQRSLESKPRAKLKDILTPPLLGNSKLTDEEIENELRNNIQGILGYVVPWVENGIGCSKIADINNVYLMEDRATLRISSQHVANWMHQGITTEEHVEKVFREMAVVVDRQNAGKPGYKNMAPDFHSSVAFQAAHDLVFQGCESENGYTEFILTARRREAKNKYQEANS